MVLIGVCDIMSGRSDRVLSVLGLSCSRCLVVTGTSTSIKYVYIYTSTARLLVYRVLTSSHPLGT